MASNSSVLSASSPSSFLGIRIFDRVAANLVCHALPSLTSIQSQSVYETKSKTLAITCNLPDRSKTEERKFNFSFIPRAPNFSAFTVHSIPFSAVQSLFSPSLWNWTSRRSEEEREVEELFVEVQKGLESVERKLDSAASSSPGSMASSIVTSFLITYSVLASDWWQFKHTAGDRLAEAMLSHPVGRGYHRISQPLSIQLEKLLEMSSKIQILDKILGSGKKTDEERADVNPSELVMPQGIIWEQRTEDIEAERRRGLLSAQGFSFSAAGLLFPYHLGVTQCLIEHGLMKDNTPLAGSSAGSIVCAVIASGLGMQQALEATKALAKDCRANGTAFRLGLVLRNFLEEFLPENAHELSSGRIRVAVTQVFRSPRGLLVDSFDSREDLINSLVTSSFVPGYLAPTPFTKFRDRLCMDGGLSNFMPPTAGKETVRVCAFPGSSLGLTSIQISPDLNPNHSASMRQLFTWALQPADDDILDGLFEKGYNDCLVWIQKKVKNGTLVV